MDKPKTRIKTSILIFRMEVFLSQFVACLVSGML
jgi:hypothetical protein